MESMITPAPIPRRGLLYERDSSTSNGNGSGALDTCGYLSGNFASPLTCGSGYTCSTGPSYLPSHLGCCNAVNCAPSSGAHTCITAESGSIPCTGDFSSDCISEWTSLLFCTDPTAPACVTYSAPPPSSGSAASMGLSPTIFSYSCGPTQTTHIYLATATNAPASASPSPSPHSGPVLPLGAWIGIGVAGGLIVLLFASYLTKCAYGAIRESRIHKEQRGFAMQRNRTMWDMGMPGAGMGMGPGGAAAVAAGRAPSLSALSGAGNGSGGSFAMSGGGMSRERERLVRPPSPARRARRPDPEPSDFGGTAEGEEVASWLRNLRP